MKTVLIQGRRAGKTQAAVEQTKEAQQAGKTVIWVPLDLVQTSETLARHNALSEVTRAFLIPHFRRKD